VNRNRWARVAPVAAIVIFTCALASAPAFGDTAPPMTTPNITAPIDASTVAGDVALSASSSAPSVQFSLDGVPFGSAVPAVAGVASTDWPTWGFANGSHTWTAADCNDFGCNTELSTPVTVALDDASPAVTSPIDGATASTSIGLTATASGGGLAFFVDGLRVGFDATAPYAFAVAGPLTPGAHTAYVQECDTADTSCAGPTSPIVSFTVKTLHPRITAVSPNPFSPHADGRSDTTTFRLNLPDIEQVSFFVKNAGGQVVNGPHTPGALGTGNHTFVWNGKNNLRNIVNDGVYTIVVTTSAPSGSVTLHGTATATVRVDDTPPGLSGVRGNGSTFYPVRDGYLDTFSPKVTVNEAARIWLDIYNSVGTKVREISQSHAGTGTFAITWNGLNAAGRLVLGGTYRFVFVAQDPAGNRRTSPNYRVRVRHERLVNKAVTLTRYGASGSIRSTDWSCTGYSYGLSSFAHGVWLANVCNEKLDGPQALYAFETFTVPGAARYNSIRVESYGSTVSAPEAIGALIYNSSTHSWNNVKAIVLAKNRTSAWSNYGTVSAAGHVSGGRAVQVSIYVPDSNPPQDYDLGSVEITVAYSVLR
jgi:flagellar hook assembly protein FlgD